VAAEFWDEVKRQFHAALELPAAEREDFFRRIEERDPGLAREVQSLVAAHESEGERFEEVVARERREVLSAAARSRLGLHCGPYELVRLIGEGGMGQVFLARRADATFRKEVAIKLVRQELGGDQILRRFRAERQLLAGLDHPGIARLVDGGATDDGVPYLVMEYVPGVPIDRFCDEHGLELEERLALFRRVCEAVEAAHKSLVVHRDIKASNVLVTPEGEPKLLDFGVAKILPGGEREETLVLTRAEGAPLTLASAAPEQVSGGQITTATDTYALGLLLYRLLTGVSAYEVPTSPITEAVRVICERLPSPPSEAIPANGFAERWRRRLRGDLDNIVLKALRKDPGRRYSSVEQFAEDIRRHLSGMPVLARPDTLGYRAGKFVRRHAVAVTAGAVVIVALVGGLTATLWQARRAERERIKAERVSGFLINTLSAADASWTSGAGRAGADVKVSEALDEAAARVHRELGEEPEVEAVVRRTLGQTYYSLAKLQAADRELQEALRLFRKTTGDESAETAQTLYWIGRLQVQRGEVDAGVATLEGVLAARRRTADRTDELMANTLNDLGLAYLARGDNAAALPLLEEMLAIERRRVGEAHPRVAIPLNNLGLIHDRLGHVETAERYYRESIASFARIPGRELPESAFPRQSLGVMRLVQGRLPEAERLLRETVAIWTRGFGEDHPNTANARVPLGTVLFLSGDAPAGEREIRSSLAQLERALPAGHSDLARAWTALGPILCATARAVEGEDKLRRAVALRRKLLKAGDWRIAESVGALGGCLAREGRVREARNALQESQTLFSAALGPTHPRTHTVELELGKVAAVSR
jgi:tetratricopeptide (TPR) repeat protein/tRNA A-37 threonylcarbamoyl transferase component Bud32